MFGADGLAPFFAVAFDAVGAAAFAAAFFGRFLSSPPGGIMSAKRVPQTGHAPRSSWLNTARQIEHAYPNSTGCFVRKQRALVSGSPPEGCDTYWRMYRSGRQQVTRYCDRPRRVASSARKYSPPLR